MRAHGLVIGGVESGGGKTAITCALLAGLRGRGIAAQPYKAGPDFIDPAYHERFSGVVSRNLDEWLLGAAGIDAEIAATLGGKIGVVEGVMGLFDGGSASTDEGSTYALARRLDWPIVLVVPCAKAGRSLAAVLRGFLEEAGRERIAGVILNEVGGPGHADYLEEAIAPLNLRIFGWLPREELLRWPERHLGLRASQEMRLPGWAELAALAERWLDLDGLLGLVVAAPSAPAARAVSADSAGERTIAVIKDEVFHFYYPSNLDFLRERGARLVEVSALRDSVLPTGIQALYIGGGFPEEFASALADNRSLRVDIRRAVRDGLPCYAECGGLMYLAEDLVVGDGRRFPMTGLLPGRVEMTARLQNFGYCTAQRDGLTVNGHEFHHSRWLAEPEQANLWRVRKKRSGETRVEGYRYQRLHASYVHILFRAAPAFAVAAFDWPGERGETA
jgi:cobyrinic acid a,c-diamide synthase